MIGQERALFHMKKWKCDTLQTKLTQQHESWNINEKISLSILGNNPHECQWWYSDEINRHNTLFKLFEYKKIAKPQVYQDLTKDRIDL